MATVTVTELGTVTVTTTQIQNTHASKTIYYRRKSAVASMSDETLQPGATVNLPVSMQVGFTVPNCEPVVLTYA